MARYVGKSIGLGLGIILLAAGIIGLFRFNPADPSESLSSLPEDSLTSHEAGWILGVWNGQLAVFAPGAPEPYELYDIYIASLPEEEQARLQGGVIAKSKSDLESLLEDYTS